MPMFGPLGEPVFFPSLSRTCTRPNTADVAVHSDAALLLRSTLPKGLYEGFGAADLRHRGWLDFPVWPLCTGDNLCTGRYTDLRQTLCSKAHTVQYITTHIAATGIRAALRCYHSANLMAV